MEKIKGLDILLDVFSQLPHEKLVIAGTGSQYEEYKSRATSNIQFVGFLDRDNLSRCLSKAKAVIVPSQWYETFGNIASLVEEGITGLRFDYDSADALREAVVRMDSMDVASMRTEAYRKYKTEFTAEGNYSSLKMIYDSLADR